MLEIERKFIIYKIPENINNYPFSHIVQFYLHEDPVLRIRKTDNNYFLTYKSKGLIARNEIELNIDKTLFDALYRKADKFIDKIRYKIPYCNHIIELDIFNKNLSGLILAEVEFKSVEEADNFNPPEWFGKDVTNFPKYQNVNLIKEGNHE